MKLLNALILVFLIGNAPTVLGAGLPRYDVEAYCKGVAENGSASNTIYNGCIDIEQQAYDSLKADWSSLPAHVRNYCKGVASTGGSGSYSTLKGCVDMELEAGKNRESFER